MKYSIAIIGVTILAWDFVLDLRRPEGQEPWYVVVLALATLTFWLWFVLTANGWESEARARDRRDANRKGES